ncbi:MAG: type II toxin-antitoxin system HigB family toxin [Bacteroidales bacterium]|nr:type II toxin-antitoxin system HigB family toxin [Bacteroidales bacterium]MBQ9194040.1 type II toxin-antitoxin system HigB family toxin [Bacteroidales bacterium]MBR1783125.1 type II toxin-antitoxin system HigB family toxin [Bacteroidales bacterium]
MRVIAISTQKAFWEKHPDAEQPLKEWYLKTCRAQWKTLADIRKDFNTVDYVGNQHYVFNIKGNHYRLVTAIKFKPALVYIRFVGTHDEYDRIDASTI